MLEVDSHNSQPCIGPCQPINSDQLPALFRACAGYHFKDARASANKHAKEHELPEFIVPIVDQLKANATACSLACGAELTGLGSSLQYQCLAFGLWPSPFLPAIERASEATAPSTLSTSAHFLRTSSMPLGHLGLEFEACQSCQFLGVALQLTPAKTCFTGERHAIHGDVPGHVHAVPHCQGSADNEATQEREVTGTSVRPIIITPQWTTRPVNSLQTIGMILVRASQNFQQHQ